MLLGPKYKICKRLGSNVFEKCQTKSFAARAQRGDEKKGRRAGSDFKRQLIEKQKLRLIYSLTEKQFAGYVKEALSSGENPSQYLFMKLETRLDSFLFRTGLASTRRAARQMASHGHATVNGRRVTVPSYELAVGATVAVRDASKSTALFQGLSDKLKERALPTWITFDVDAQSATLTALPSWGERDSIVDFGAVFEYYTR
jgi:small subunit ribosomal protein S4